MADEEQTKTLWRGVSSDHPNYEDALQGMVKPRGGHSDPDEHNSGNTESEFTSWTSNREIAKMYALASTGKGVILEKQFSVPANERFAWSPDEFYEQEVLVRGIVIDAKVIEVEK